jgi:hypothetical protein
MSAWSKSYDEFTDAMLDIVQGVGDRLNGRLRKVEREVAELKAALVEQQRAEPSVKWAGVHADGVLYRAGNLVTKSGLWLAMQDTHDVPGHSPHWRLIVKQQKDPR